MLKIEYTTICGHKSAVIKEYDFSKEEEVYRYDSFIQFNKPGIDFWCSRCQKQKSLLGFDVRKI